MLSIRPWGRAHLGRFVLGYISQQMKKLLYKLDNILGGDQDFRKTENRKRS